MKQIGQYKTRNVNNNHTLSFETGIRTSNIRVILCNQNLKYYLAPHVNFSDMHDIEYLKRCGNV